MSGITFRLLYSDGEFNFDNKKFIDTHRKKVMKNLKHYMQFNLESIDFF